jgi:hypothetical protein
MAKQGKHLRLPPCKFWMMREGPETNVLRAESVPEAKEPGLSLKRIFREQVPVPATRTGGRTETTMPTHVREPLWYRHWGLNE